MSDIYRRVSIRAFLGVLTPQGMHGRGGRVAHLEVGISTYLYFNRGRLVSKRELLDWIYQDDQNGGIEWAESALRGVIFKLRHQHKIRIVNYATRGYMIEERAP